MTEPNASNRTETQEDLEAAVSAMIGAVSWDEQKLLLAEYFEKVSGQFGRWAELEGAQQGIDSSAAVVTLAAMGTAELLGQAGATVDPLGSRTPTESVQSAALWSAVRVLHDTMGQIAAIMDQPVVSPDLAAASAVFVMMMGRAGHGLVQQAVSSSADVVASTDGRL